ncbi:MAG: hypothetical protein GY795_24575 [Desulfobacterales bacterium]|nr:hypothetical protein [Desulfobacterales bacterium]
MMRARTRDGQLVIITPPHPRAEEWWDWYERHRDNDGRYEPSPLDYEPEQSGEAEAEFDDYLAGA